MPRPLQVDFDLLTLKVVSESRVTWTTSVPILVFLGLSVLDLSPMFSTDRQTSDAHHRLMPPLYGGGGTTTFIFFITRTPNYAMDRHYCSQVGLIYVQPLSLR